MRLTLTPAVLEAAYNFLKATKPYSGWKMPDSSEIEFWVGRRRGEFGCYVSNGNKYPYHRIHVSAHMVKATHPLIATMAHEMVHVRDQILDPSWPHTDDDGHGPKFQKMADMVCRIHGFDRSTF